MRAILVAASLGLGLTEPLMASAQGLAEVARAAEAARKEGTGKPAGKVYTNKDLPTVDRPASTGAPTEAPAVSALEPTPSASADSPSPDRGEAYWRERMRPLRERLEHDRAAAQTTKQRAEVLMRSADRCFQIGIVCEDYTESLRLTDQHKTLVADVARGEEAVAALEDEARRAGVPPGWLRP
jgi:hypothetical protein